MKLNEEKIESKSIGVFEGEINSSIAEENLGLALRMVSKNLYSDPIGSIVREITSNAVDANVGANEESPVMIHFYEEDEGAIIEFKDKGVGMSPDTFKNIYMSWFNSDKRADNSRIGGWGLGSKSPLSYTDSFEIITIFDGIKYEYLFGSDNDLPKAELIDSSSTTDSNGTTIRIYVNYEDTWEFTKALDKQLTYFDNVYVKNEINYYDNHFKIYESDNYKLRNNSRPFGDEMHLVLGQVAYPINFEVLGISPVYIPIGLKFDIGELDVVLSREEINYNDKTKENILNKLEIVKSNLLAKYDIQLKFTDLLDFIATSNNTTNLPPLVIKDVSIPMKGLKAERTYIGLEGLELDIKQAKTLLDIVNIFKLQSGKVYKKNVVGNHVLWNYRNRCYIYDKVSYWDAKYIQHGYLITNKKISKKLYRLIAVTLNCSINTKHNYNVIVQNENGVEYDRVPQERYTYILGTSKKVAKVIKFIKNYIETKLPPLKGQAPEGWVNEQKALKAIKKDRDKGEFVHYSIPYNKRETFRYEDLNNYKAVFFIYKDMNDTEKDDILKFWNTFHIRFRTDAKLLSVSKTVGRQIINRNNVHEFPDVFKVKSLNNYFTRLALYNKYETTLRSQFSGNKTLINKRNKVNNILNISIKLKDYYLLFKENIDPVIKNNHKYDYLLPDLNFLDKTVKSNEFIVLRSLIDNGSVKAIRAFMKINPVLGYSSNYYDHTLVDKIRLKLEEERRKLKELEEEKQKQIEIISLT